MESTKEEISKRIVLNINSGQMFNYTWTEEEKRYLMNAVRLMMAIENKREDLDGIIYIPEFYSKDESAKIMGSLVNELNWEKRDTTPRMEYYCNTVNVPYVYGRGRGVREYLPQPMNDSLLKIKADIQRLESKEFEVCFLNRYENQKDHLGWHADDSPEMDDDKPIIIVTFGVEREIWFRKQNDKENIKKLLLGNGSVCIMPAGFQDSHYHRIPKAGFECGRRISLTFRGYKHVNN